MKKYLFFFNLLCCASIWANPGTPLKGDQLRLQRIADCTMWYVKYGDDFQKNSCNSQINEAQSLGIKKEDIRTAVKKGKCLANNNCFEVEAQDKEINSAIDQILDSIE